MILGLDVSTTMIGVCVLGEPETQTVDFNGSKITTEKRELLLSTNWNIGDKKEYPDSFTKAEAVAAELYQLSLEYNITEIYIEDFVRGLSHRFNSNLNILLALARFNGLVSWNCYEIFGIKPILVNVSKARTNYGLIFPRGTKSAARKKMVVEKVIEKEGTKFSWSFNRNGINYSKGVDDRADAIVIARYAESLIKNKDSKGFLTTKMKIDS